MTKKEKKQIYDCFEKISELLKKEGVTTKKEASYKVDLANLYGQTKELEVLFTEVIGG
jgi:hypothetical protein